MPLLIGLIATLVAMAWQASAPRDGGNKWRNRAENIGLWTINILLAGLCFVAPDQLRPSWQLPGYISLGIGFLLLDWLGWAVHRAQHTVPWLMRWHALHHGENRLDWSSAVRQHPIEGLLTTFTFWLVIMASGVPGWVAGVHSAATLCLAFLTHADIRWPAALERALRPILVTIELHRFHHGIKVEQQTSNYGAVLSIWDRFAKTLHAPSGEKIIFGRE